MKRRVMSAGTSRLAWALPALAVLTCAAAPGALAQADGYYSPDPNVSIDLSVLGGPAYSPPGYAYPPVGSGAPGGGSAWYGQAPAYGAPAYGTSPYGAQSFGLQFPPSSAPRSRLTGPLSGQDVRLSPPSRAASPAPQPASPSTASASPPRQPAETRPSSPPPAATPPAEPTTSARAEPPATPEPASTPAAPSVTPPPTPSSAATAPEPAPSAPANGTAPDGMDTQTAARSTAGAATSSGLDHTGPGGMTRIVFETGSAKVPASADPMLDELASELNANDALRVQLMAYADGDNDAANPARRLSLSRALAVRTALIEKGVRSTRMDVRALGNKYADGPADRVDAVLVER